MEMGIIRWEWEGNGNKKVIPAHLWPTYVAHVVSTRDGITSITDRRHANTHAGLKCTTTRVVTCLSNSSSRSSRSDSYYVVVRIAPV